MAGRGGAVLVGVNDGERYHSAGQYRPFKSHADYPPFLIAPNRAARYILNQREGHAAVAQKMFSKAGNTAGFTAEGHPVCGQYSSKAKQWSVWADAGLGALTNSRRRIFAKPADAEAYASTLIDSAKTNELKWW